MSFSRSTYNRTDPRMNPAVAEACQRVAAIVGLEMELRCDEDYLWDWDAIDHHNRPCIVESQVKESWWGNHFPYNTVFILQRYANKAHTQMDSIMSVPCYQMILSNDLKHAVCVDWEVLRTYGGKETVWDSYRNEWCDNLTIGREFCTLVDIENEEVLNHGF